MNATAKTTRTTTFEALLGMLSLGPMTGYEIRHRIEASIGNFWSESFGQIYPTLAKLHEQGFVKVKPAHKAGGKEYSLTSAGRKRLREWLGEMPQPRKPRNELLLKLFFASPGEAATARAQVSEHHSAYAADLLRYQVITQQVKTAQAQNPNLPFFLMTLNYGLAQSRALLAWADQTIAALDELERKTKLQKEKK